MNTALSPVSLQPELFQLTVMAQHGCLLPATSGLTPMPNGPSAALSTCWINIFVSLAFLYLKYGSP